MRHLELIALFDIRWKTLQHGYLVDDFKLVNVTSSDRFKKIIKRFKRVG